MLQLQLLLNEIVTKIVIFSVNTPLLPTIGTYIVKVKFTFVVEIPYIPIL